MLVVLRFGGSADLKAVHSQLPDEIAAIDWLSSPQRVTALEPRDLDAYG
jgi:hypothetical protein